MWDTEGVQVQLRPEMTTTGGTLWPAARRCVQFLGSSSEALGLHKPGATVLELGSGLGFLGLCMARNMPQARLICMTEQTAGGGLDWLEHNVRLHHLGPAPLPASPCMPASLAGAPPTGLQAGARTAPWATSPERQPPSAQQPAQATPPPPPPQQPQGVAACAPQPPQTKALPGCSRLTAGSPSQLPGAAPPQLHGRPVYSCWGTPVQCRHCDWLDWAASAAERAAVGCLAEPRAAPLCCCPLGGRSAGNGELAAAVTASSGSQLQQAADLQVALHWGPQPQPPLAGSSGMTAEPGAGSEGCAGQPQPPEPGHGVGCCAACRDAADLHALTSTHWDFIVGSDLIYNHVGSRLLPRVMRQLAARDTAIIYCHTKHRFDHLDMEFLEEVAANGLSIQEVREEGLDTPPPSPPPLTELFPEMRIAVYQLRKEAQQGPCA